MLVPCTHLTRTVVAAVALASAGAACEARTCAVNLGEVAALFRHAAFAAHWQETSMQDGKPLLVTLSERDGELHLRFVKSGEGLWAEGVASVCLHNGTVEARLSQRRISVGPAANWLLRQSLAGGARFVLAPQASGQLRIATPGWNGTFVPTRD